MMKLLTPDNLYECLTESERGHLELVGITVDSVYVRHTVLNTVSEYTWNGRGYAYTIISTWYLVIENNYLAIKTL